MLLDDNDEVSGLEVSGDGKGDVDVTNGLLPLVGEGGLFLLLLCAGGGFVCGGDDEFCLVSCLYPNSEIVKHKPLSLSAMVKFCSVLSTS